MSDIPDPGSGSGLLDVDFGRGLRIVGVVVVVPVLGVLLGGYHQVPEGHVGVQKSFGAVTGDEPSRAHT